MAPHPNSESQYQQIVQRLQAAVAAGDLDGWQSGLLAWYNLENRELFSDPALRVCATPFDPDLLANLPATIKLYVLRTSIMERIRRFEDLSEQLAFLASPAALTGVRARHHPPFLYLWLVILLLRGESEAAAEIHRRHQRKLRGLGLDGWLHFLNNAPDRAVKAFHRELATLRRREKQPNACFTGLEGLIYALSLLAADNHRHLPRLKTLLGDLAANQPTNPWWPAYKALEPALLLLENQRVPAHRHLRTLTTGDNAFGLLFLALAHHWLSTPLPHRLTADLTGLAERARQHHYHWLLPTLQALLNPKTATSQASNETAGLSLTTIITGREAWHHALLALEQQPGRPAPGPAPPANPERRLAWLLDYQEARQSATFKPVIQHRQADGSWSRGRPLALKRLLEPGPLRLPRHQVLQDHRDDLLRAAIRCQPTNGGTACSLDPELDPGLLAGHPHLFLAANPTSRIRLDRGRPTLLLQPRGDGKLLARLLPFPAAGNHLLLRQGPADFLAISVDRQLRELAVRLGPAGLSWPAADPAGLLDHLAPLPGGLDLASADPELPLTNSALAADSRPLLQLLPSGRGLRLRLRVRPLGPEGPCLPPGYGLPILWQEQDGRYRRVCRDLAREKELAAALTELCELSAAAAESGETDQPTTWLLPAPRQCLELLERLRRQTPEVRLEWPQGEALSLSPTAGLSQLRLKIAGRENWFGLEGSLQLDNGLVIELEQLLRAASGHGRFIPLGQDQFLSLSSRLRKKLDEIATLAEINNRQIRLHPLAARLLLAAPPDPNREDNDQAQQNLKLTGDRAWHEFLERLHSADQSPAPPPAELQTTLRGYQLAGYRWLLQLAELGFGACLADDMGLGKTVQTLALLLQRAAGGPALVVAPTSVCENWLEESRRWAPGLKATLYGGPRRRRHLQNPPAHSLLICSYALLQRDAEDFAGCHWHTIVLDEAQAIKNFLAKRSRAARQLRGAFKLITTGTPLENHLAELWTLFHFINPGLLGTLDHFSKRFIVPVQQNDDPQARRRLQQLLKPFVLRRLKREVLQELPPRTDITLRVELSREEAAFYEALRRRALANLEEEVPANRSPLRILAEIMKLRRACCHPRLVLPTSELPGSKQQLFRKLITELRENGHRALVFSQFVDHLSLIRELLDDLGITYCYLDGRTPAPKRRRQIKAFQEGEGDLFLISLRAGGLGLNLTAADYVIHLDPWWNPAVEEQASDRVHRIGQQKPVTIYRLIAAGTIEEKILALHQRKRRLASDLLDGSRQGPPQSAAELLALLQDHGE